MKRVLDATSVSSDQQRTEDDSFGTPTCFVNSYRNDRTERHCRPLDPGVLQMDWFQSKHTGVFALASPARHCSYNDALVHLALLDPDAKLAERIVTPRQTVQPASDLHFNDDDCRFTRHWGCIQ